MRLTRAKKIMLAILLSVVILIAVNARWVYYVFHLARHQLAVVAGKKPIAGLLAENTVDAKTREQLLMVEDIRRFTETSYALSRSASYASFYDLGRPVLGYNITVTPEFSLKPVAFSFFPIGSFEYLGFFDRTLAEKWAGDYRRRGNDVHLSEIGGYSTLGWFEDPLYSTQLAWGEYGLARLIGHEIAHERLYFNNDTAFSEALASFVERRLAADYMHAKRRPMPNEAAIALRRRRLNEFSELIDDTKKKLQTLYASTRFNELDISEKRRSKAAIFQRLRETLNEKKTYFADIPAAAELTKSPEINNATLVQFHRYSPVHEAFAGVLKRCAPTGNVYTCWFSELEKLKPCSNEARQRWLKSDGTKVDCR